MPRRGPARILMGVAIVIGLAGAVFALQGLGAPIGRSFMIGDLRWTAIGLAMLVVAALLAWWEWRRG